MGPPVEWYLARHGSRGRIIGPTTFEALVEAVDRGEIAGADGVWQPGADRWERADDTALWLPTSEPAPLPRWRLPWWRAAAIALAIFGGALPILRPKLARVEPDNKPVIYIGCTFNDHVNGRCR
jgi:hypothetical protein